jgi:DNA-binding NtrC family response regulator
MDSTYIAIAKSSQDVLKTATLFKNLNVNAYISGETGTGKSLLAHYMLPTAIVVDGSSREELDSILSNSDEVIIENFHLISNFEKLNFSGKKIIAISATLLSDTIIDKYFGIKVTLKPLNQRPEDIPLIAQKFLNSAKSILMIDSNIALDVNHLDISDNCHSLKKSIYFNLLQENINENELIIMMKNFLRKNLEGNNIYRDFLYLYDKPLIEAGLEQYGSQLKLSDILGINRNTLRKKIQENDIKVHE